MRGLDSSGWNETGVNLNIPYEKRPYPIWDAVQGIGLLSKSKNMYGPSTLRTSMMVNTRGLHARTQMRRHVWSHT